MCPGASLRALHGGAEHLSSRGNENGPETEALPQLMCGSATQKTTNTKASITQLNDSKYKAFADSNNFIFQKKLFVYLLSS